MRPIGFVFTLYVPLVNISTKGGVITTVNFRNFLRHLRRKSKFRSVRKVKTRHSQSVMA